MAETFRPYRSMMRAQIRAQMSYRTSFLVELAGSTLFTSLDLFTVFVMFRVTRTLGSFPLPAVFLMASIASLGFATADALVGNMDRLQVAIRTGQLDTLLVRPIGLLRHLLVADFQMRKIGRVVQGLIAVTVAVVIAHLRWSVPAVAMLVLAPAAAAVFFMAVFVTGGTVAFWWIESGEFANGFTYGGRDFATYPMPLYGHLFRRIFAYGLGFAFVAYYPALVLLRRPDPLGLPAWAGWTSPLVAALAAGIAALVWRIGIRHYRSTGS